MLSYSKKLLKFGYPSRLTTASRFLFSEKNKPEPEPVQPEPPKI